MAFISFFFTRYRIF